MNVLGLDLLGLANKNVDMKDVIKAFPQGFALGIFARAFGDAIPNVRKLLDTGKVSNLRVQLWWADNHQIAPIKFLVSEAPRWEALANQYPHIQFFVSHSCEYSEKNKGEIKKRVELIQKLCPSCIPVQSPMHSPVIKGFGLIEEHGTKAKVGAQIVSADGICSADINTPKWLRKHEGALIRFLHAPRFNLQHHVKPPVKLPPREKRKAAPSFEYITGIVRNAVPVPDYGSAILPGNPPIEKLKKPNLWKVYSEDTNPGTAPIDPRGCKPMFFVKRRKKKAPEPFLDILCANGTSIGRLMLYKDKNPSRTTERYYAGSPGSIGLFGWQIADLAVMSAGSPFIWLRQGKKIYGPIHAALRVPFYQKQK